MTEEKVERIDANLESISSEPQQIQKTQPAGEAPGKEEFAAALNAPQRIVGAPPIQPQGAAPSLMDAVRDMNFTGTEATRAHPTPEALVAQTQAAIAQIEDIKRVLETPNASIKQSAQQLLRNKLIHIDESLKIALSKAGVEYSPIEQVAGAASPTRTNPIERFLGFLADGQWQLQHLGTELQNLSASGKDLTPVNMLAVQVKVAQIQQELELFTSLLNKGLESIKTVMNIQV